MSAAQDPHAMLELMKNKTKEYVGKMKAEHAVETDALRKEVSVKANETKVLQEKLKSHDGALKVLKMSLTDIGREDLWQAVAAVAAVGNGNGNGDGADEDVDSILRSQMLQASQTINTQVWFGFARFVLHGFALHRMPRVASLSLPHSSLLYRMPRVASLSLPIPRVAPLASRCLSPFLAFPLSLPFRLSPASPSPHFAARTTFSLMIRVASD
jgi:hypothetical protein